MVSQLIPSIRSGCTKEGQMEAVPQSTFSWVSVLTHSAAFSFLSGCAGTVLTPPRKLFLPCCLLSCFSRAFLLPTCVSSSSWMLCFLQKQQIAVMLSFWSNETNSYNNDVHVFLSTLLSNGAWRHTSLSGSCFFYRYYLYCHWYLSLISFSPPQPQICIVSFSLTVRPSEPPRFTCPPCGLLLLFSKGKPLTHSKCRNDLNLTTHNLMCDAY